MSEGHPTRRAAFFMRKKVTTMKKFIFIALSQLGIMIWALPAVAHFGMVIPSNTMIMPQDGRTVHLTLSFSHPFDGHGMPMVKPKKVAVLTGEKQTDLKNQLKPNQVMGAAAWTLDYPIKRPGVYQFYMEPQPYWEPAEDSYIIHYTKTVIAAFGNESGWDAALGLKTEIVPLSRPFGLFAGNVFRAMVMRDGKPVPHAPVEIEYYNRDGRARAATDFMVTHTVKADASGIFVYSPPVSGWWGFAALSDADFKLNHDGVDKDVELGAVIWVQFHDWETK
jgi:cobalt/nickel transport protein